MVCSGFISVALKKSTKLTGCGTDMELKDLWLSFLGAKIRLLYDL